MRIDYDKVAPEAVKTMLVLEKFVNSSGLEKSLLDLVKLRVSQMNGCAYCVDVHCTDARKHGISNGHQYKFSGCSIYKMNRNKISFIQEYRMTRPAYSWREDILVSE